LLLALAVLVALTVCETAMAQGEEDAATAAAQQEVSPIRKFFNSPQYRWGMTFVNFGIICFLFRRYAWKPVLGFLDARAREVAETLERSQLAKERAEAELREAIRKLSGVKSEKDQIVELATEVSEKQRAMIVEDGQRAAERVAEQLRGDMDRARYLARKRASELLANQVMDETAKHIVETITPDNHAALIDRFINRLDRTMVA
jgi:F-type H+-transporting ATPase subunit b